MKKWKACHFSCFAGVLLFASKLEQKTSGSVDEKTLEAYGNIWMEMTGFPVRLARRTSLLTSGHFLFSVNEKLVWEK